MSNAALLIQASARRLPLVDSSIHCCITSPPYWALRDYGLPAEVWDGGWTGCLGLEPTPALFVEHLVEVMREVRRVLRPDGTLWLNLGDSYASSPVGSFNGGGFKDKSARSGGRDMSGVKTSGMIDKVKASGCKPKDLIGIPWRVAFALQADGWWLRDCIIWSKPNPMPSSVTDRTTTSHEYVFLLTKSARYFYDADAIREPVTSTGGASFGKQNHDAAGTGQQSRRLASPEERNNPLGRNKRSVWTVSTQSYHGAHFATFPTRLVEPMVKAGTSEKGCCPTCGAPWRRVVERMPLPSVPEYEGKWAATDPQSSGRKLLANVRRGRAAGLPHDNPISPRNTTHWLPSCRCSAHQPVPCIVLDPFAGSGTTLQVSRALGRRSIGIDRKLEYLELAKEREPQTPKLSHHTRPAARKPATAPAGPWLFDAAAERGAAV